MSDVARTYPTASHVFALAPAAAAEAFDVMILDPALALRLTPAGAMTRSPYAGYRPLRALPATLHLPGRGARTLPVTLELLPWSDGRTELTIWSKKRPGLFVHHSVAAYLHATRESLTTLAELLTSDLVIADRSRHAGALPAARDRRLAAIGD